MRKKIKKRNRYVKYIAKYKYKYTMLLGAYTCVVFTQLIIPMQISSIISNFSNVELEYIVTQLSVIFALIFLESMGTYFFADYNHKLSNMMTVDAEHDTLQKMLRIRYDRISGLNSAYLSQRINNDLCYIMDFYVEQIPYLLFKSIKSFAIIIVLLKINVYIGLSSLAGVFFYILIYFSTRKKYYNLKQKHANIKAEFFSVVCGKISNILLIKINSWYEATEKDFKEVGNVFVKAAVKSLNFENLIGNMANVIGRMLIPVMLMFFSFSARTDVRNVDVLIGFSAGLIYLQELISSVQFLVKGGEIYQSYKVSYDRMEEVFEMQPELNGDVKVSNVRQIHLQNVCFAYNEHELLRDVSVRFEKGKAYAITGGNGSGKTTLVLLMLGILKPNQGEILWNETELAKIDTEDLRKNIVGFVNQEPMLMEDTIYNNIYYGYVGEKKEMEELHQYPLLDFVKNQPQAYDTRIDSKTANLSGGQKQRIAIMRTLLKDTEVVILDEPTSALDEKGIELFINLVREIKLDKIIIIISHDSQIVEACDEVVRI
ncbi:MAG: ABC transporter ATP-binding protein [Lachnospiraceae bacterium]|nr:ABC transporter ATP-binding protein [Lachnospiraceae bacterium]